MKIALIYATKTGHSKKIAEAIAKELQITAQNITSQPKLEEIDILFIVGGIYGGQSLPGLITFIENLDNNVVQKAALVTSCVSKNSKQDDVRSLLNDKKIIVVNDELICQGSFLLFGLGHPNKTDISSAVSFSKQIISI